MESTIILNQFWHIFLSHVCAYYPLEKEFIEQWEKDLKWHAISSNTQIEWTQEFLEQYEDNFTWHELARNESIIWTEKLIEKFKKRLDWYYLGQNPHLPLSVEFLEKYKKKIVYIVDTNPNLSEELKTQYKLTVYPDRNGKVTTLSEIEDLETYLKEMNPYNTVLDFYEKVFSPIIASQGLANIFENKFDYSQRYFYLEAKRNDIFGLTPEFIIIDEKLIFSDNKNEAELFDIDREICLKNGTLQEGKDRLLHTLRLCKNFPFYSEPTLLVSETVKAILEQFKLPMHAFYPVKINHRKIKSDVQYFIFHVVNNTLFNDLDYEKSSFSYKLYGDDYTKYPLTDKINNYQELQAWQEDFRAKNELKFPKIKANIFYMKADIDYDVFSIDGKIIVNDFVRIMLEKHCKNQMDFTSLQLMPIKINQEKYDAKKQVQQSINISNKAIYTLTEKELFYQAKMERLQSSQEKISIDMTEDDIFRAKELELNVIFPKYFKTELLNKKIRFRGFKMLKPHDFYIENEYAERYPETYKSVVIASDGSGDTINILLEENSDYSLLGMFYRFCHESGQVKKLY